MPGTLVLAALLAAPQAGDRPWLVNARVETRSVRSGLAATVGDLVGSRPGPLWIGYAVPAVGDGQTCCWSSTDDVGGARCPGCRLEGGGAFALPAAEGGTVRLEGSREIAVLLRAESGRVMKVRSVSLGCALDGGGLPFHWLTGVRPPESLAYLASLVDGVVVVEGGTPGKGLTGPALAAIAHHDDPDADARLESFVAPSRPERLRKQAAFWMGNARGRRGYQTLRRLVRNDADPRFREHAVFALTQSREPEAVETIVEVARRDESARVRGQALFWLAQKAGRKAATAITAAIHDDPETEVKKKAVFALSQLPKDEGVPLLIQTARTHRNPAVRKQALFWLGQSQDPRALALFEEILLKR
jgi:hypothetical protein